MSSNLEILGVIDSLKAICISMATGGEFSYEKYEEERQKALTYPTLVGLLPSWVVEYRYGQQYWNFISSKFSTYSERRTFLRGEFEDVEQSVKLGASRPISSTIEVSLRGIGEEYVSDLWRKIIFRAQNDPEGAITASRSLLEAVMKYVLDKEGVIYSKNDDLGVLYRSVKKALNLDPANHNVETFKQILTGVTSVVQGFGSLRNDYGDAHGKGKDSYIPEQRHAELVINLAGSLSTFIIDTYNTKTP